MGSVLRYLASSIGVGQAVAGQFPVRTFVVNMVGCLIIGLLTALFSAFGWRGEWKNMLIAGFCGGFTTFSTFSREAMDLMNGGYVWMAVAYVALSVVLGLGLVAVGYAVVGKVVG